MYNLVSQRRQITNFMENIGSFLSSVLPGVILFIYESFIKLSHSFAHAQKKRLSDTKHKFYADIKQFKRIHLK